MKRLPGILFLACLLLAAGARSVAAGTFTFQISVNTSSQSGTAGAIEFQLANFDPAALPLTATITGFTGAVAGTVPNPLPNQTPPFDVNPEGNVTGVLPGQVVLSIDPPSILLISYLVQNLTYGDSLQLTVTLTGPGITDDNTAPPTSFAIFFYNGPAEDIGPPSVDNPVPSTPIFSSPGSSAGEAVGIEVPPPNEGQPTVLPPDPGVVDVVEVTVPEPAALVLLGMGLGALAWRRFRS